MSRSPDPRGPLQIPDSDSKELELQLLLLDPENLRLLEQVHPDLAKVEVKLIGQRSIQRNEARQWVESAEGQARIMEIVRNQRTEIGIAS